MQHIVAVSQFDRAWIEQLFDRADIMRKGQGDPAALQGKILATLFYEPSTRTRLSFESAMLRLGGQVISTENAREFSSAIKGETVEDTVRIVSGYADGIVIRHHEQGASQRAAVVSPVPIINGGDGPGEHPTQALLDFYTIRAELGKLDGVRIALVGDLRYGRAARSLAMLFRLVPDAELIFVSPPAVPMGDDIKHLLDEHHVRWHDEPDMLRAIRDVDVVYQTRIQKERYATPEEYNDSKGIYIIDANAMQQMPSHAVLLHPLPRVDEITTDVDSDPRAAYFRQARNGVFVRMALLEQVLSPGNGQ
jgi:aspartate carbamoyltransferase catalytic subunit